MTLKTRIVASVSGIILLSAAAVGGVGFQVLRTSQIEMEKELAVQGARETLTSIGRIINHQMSVLSVMSGLTVFQEALLYDFFPDEAIDYCAEMARRDPWIVNVVLLDSEDRIVAANDPSILVRSYSRRGVDLETAEGEVHLGGLIRDAEAGLDLYVVVADASGGEASGKLVVEYDWGQLLGTVAAEQGWFD